MYEGLLGSPGLTAKTACVADACGNWPLIANFEQNSKSFAQKKRAFFHISHEKPLTSIFRKLIPEV
ncbi:MAG: hypothetical protein J5846_03710 [Desulfovibrio sp.]|nr:hypothetical protein [Desulfovibrio sp.]